DALRRLAIFRWTPHLRPGQTHRPETEAAHFEITELDGVRRVSEIGHPRIVTDYCSTGISSSSLRDASSRIAVVGSASSVVFTDCSANENSPVDHESTSPTQSTTDAFMVLVSSARTSRPCFTTKSA